MTDADKALVERARAKHQILPALGSGQISVSADGKTTLVSTSIYDDGTRLINPDGPELAIRIEALSAHIAAQDARIAELEAGLHNMAMAAGALTVATDGEERLRPQRSKVLVVMEAARALLENRNG